MQGYSVITGHSRKIIIWPNTREVTSKPNMDTDTLVSFLHEGLSRSISLRNVLQEILVYTIHHMSPVLHSPSFWSSEQGETGSKVEKSDPFSCGQVGQLMEHFHKTGNGQLCLRYFLGNFFFHRLRLPFNVFVQV